MRLTRAVGKGQATADGVRAGRRSGPSRAARKVVTAIGTLAHRNAPVVRPSRSADRDRVRSATALAPRRATPSDRVSERRKAPTVARGRPSRRRVEPARTLLVAAAAAPRRTGRTAKPDAPIFSQGHVSDRSGPSGPARRAVSGESGPSGPARKAVSEGRQSTRSNRMRRCEGSASMRRTRICCPS